MDCQSRKKIYLSIGTLMVPYSKKAYLNRKWTLVIMVPRNDIFPDINQQTLQQQVGGVMRYVSADLVEAPDNDYPQELCIL